MTLFESSQQLIDIVVDGGAVEGYVIDTHAAEVVNWFQFRHDVYNQDVLEYLVETYERIAFLNNIHIDEDRRGTGIGKRLLDQFENVALDYGAQAIVLFCDQNEDQVEGFDLQKWYERQGYEEFQSEEALMYLPLMIKDYI